MAENRPVVLLGKIYSWETNGQGRLSLVAVDAEVQDLVRKKIEAEFQEPGLAAPEEASGPPSDPDEA